MAARVPFPTLSTSNLPQITEPEAAATASPARGKDMQRTLLNRLNRARPPPLEHVWVLWHDKQDKQDKRKVTDEAGNKVPVGDYSERHTILHDNISDIKVFWEAWNNFPFQNLAMRDSVHIFHKGVKPLWEDPRNEKGGSWTFRVPKEKGLEFFKHVSMLAIGNALQQAVKTERPTFNDDICGVTYSIRFTACLIQIWNRDAENTEGIQKLLEAVREDLPDELQPKDEKHFFYKRHADHAGFIKDN